MDEISKKMDAVYHVLVPSGACYIDYARDRVSLFNVPETRGTNDNLVNDGGIHLRVRHGGSYSFHDVSYYCC